MKRLFNVFWSCIWALAAAGTVPRRGSTTFGTQERLERFLLFNTVPPVACQVNDEFGTVLTPNACTRRGGASLGAVPVSGGGSAVCCAFTALCTAQNNMHQVLQNVTVLRSEGGPPLCMYAIPKSATPAVQRKILFRPQAPVPVQNTCQLRVELNFQYAGPSFPDGQPNEGARCSDYLQIVGSSTVVDGFTICGSTTQTIYLSYGDRDAITLTFSSASPHLARVTKIGCEQRDVLVPEHCLQQLHPELGQTTVRSFGYPNGMAIGATGVEQSYAICVRAPSANTRITWRECTEAEDPQPLDLKSRFHLSTYFTNPNPANDPVVFVQNNMPVTGAACDATSYVQVHGEEKHCGAQFNPNYNPEVTGRFINSTAKPFMLHVNTKIDDPNNFATGLLVAFPYSEPTGGAAGACTTMGLTPNALGFQRDDGGNACMPFPAQGVCDAVACMGLCACIARVTGLAPPMDGYPRSGFCLVYQLAVE